MDVEIDNLEIRAGSEGGKNPTSAQNATYSEAELQLMIEKCVERMLRQLVKR
jgi:hypothetical protein